MKRYKRFISLFLILIFFISVSSCKGIGESNSPKNIRGVINIWCSEEYEASMKFVAQAFKKVWDAASGQYYAEYTIGKAVYKIWLEDATSIKQKVALVNKYNLAGASAWRLGYETQQVWNAIADVLGQASNL